MFTYTDIIHCQRPAACRIPMSIGHRAKQFAPFAALKGFETAIHQKEQLFIERPELSEDKKKEIDFMLHQINIKDIVSVTFFENNIKISGDIGRCHTITGSIELLDEENKTISLCGMGIYFHTILDIQWR